MIVLNFIDEKAARDIHDDSFEFPDMNNPLIVSKKMIVDNGQLVAYGLAKITIEGIAVTDEKSSLFTRAKAYRRILLELGEDLRNKRFSDCHTFIKKPEVQRALEHMGFKKCNGTAMVVNL
jgi:hypothetical protein